MWTPEDWILRGSYCSRDEIAEWIEDRRKLTRTRILVHLPLDEDGLLRSLIIVRASQRKRAQSLNRRITAVVAKRSPRDRLHITLRDLVGAWDLGDQDGVATKLELVGHELLDGMPKDENGTGDLQFWLAHPGVPNRGVRSVFLGLGPPREPWLEEAPRRFAAMVNATPFAEARRDIHALKRAQQLPHVPWPREESGDSTEQFAAAALELAVEVTSADSAALYMREATRPSLLKCWGQFESESYPPDLDVDLIHDAAVSDALERQRFMHRRTSATFEQGETGESQGSELICPLPWTSAVPDGPAAGLIVLSKIGGNGSFSAYDRALVRNISLRLGMQRYATSAGQIATGISRLRRPAHSEQGEPSGELSPLVPSDVLTSLGRIDMAIPTICKATDSLSVSLRLLLPVSEATNGHGLALVRVAAYPASELARGEVVQHQDGGANWKVIRTGTSVVLDDTTTADAYTSFRPETMSELSVPVRSEGRLIGTLNLESPYLGHYGALAPLVEAFGSALGRTLADSTAVFARASLSRSLVIDGLSHDIKKHVEDAASELSRMSPGPVDASTHLSKALSLLNQVRAAADDEPEQAIELGTLLRATIRNADMPTLRHAINLEPRLLLCSLSGAQAEALRAALHGIFVNLKDHGVTSSDNPEDLIPSVTGELADIDGSNYLCLTVVNNSGLELDPLRVRDLYRVPVEGTLKKGRRLGAYLAGVRVRAVGGSLTASCIGSPSLALKTVLSIPIQAGSHG